MLGVQYKSAWFMCHRIREAMKQPPFAERLSGTVEADETYIGGKPRRANRKTDELKKAPRKATGRGTKKTPVVVLVERGGEARSFRMANVTGAELGDAMRRNIDREAHLRTDSFPSYTKIGAEFASHEVVNHLDEYVRGDALRTRLRTSSRFSSAASTACTTTFQRPIFSATSQSSTSATTRAPDVASMTPSERDSR
jgi:ISXO2-like transposase domain